MKGRTWSCVVKVTQFYSLSLNFAQLVPCHALVHAFVSVACILDRQSTILQDAVPTTFIHLVRPDLLAVTYVYTVKSNHHTDDLNNVQSVLYRLHFTAADSTVNSETISMSR